jgi:hypothetical protein
MFFIEVRHSKFGIPNLSFQVRLSKFVDPKRRSFALAFRQSNQLSYHRTVLTVSHRAAISGLRASKLRISTRRLGGDGRYSIRSDKRRPCSPANERRSVPFSERTRRFPCAQMKIHKDQVAAILF